MRKQLLQNAQKFGYKMCVVTKCAEFLLQNARYYKMRVITKCAEFLIQNALYYNMRRNFVTKCVCCNIMRSYKMRLNRGFSEHPHLHCAVGGRYYR